MLSFFLLGIVRSYKAERRLDVKIFRKSSIKSVFVWVLSLAIIGGTQEAIAHDIHIDDCHATLLLNLRTDYLETEIDTVKVTNTSRRTGDSLDQTATPVRLTPSSRGGFIMARVYQFSEAHDKEEFRGRMELLKDGVTVAQRPFRISIPNHFNCFVLNIDILITKPTALAVQTYELLDDKDFNGIPSVGDILCIRAVIKPEGESSGTAKYEDIPGLNLSLIPGSVEVSGGEVFVGNGQEDDRVVVTDIPLENNSEGVEIIYKAEVLPLVIASQGQISLVVGSPEKQEYLTATMPTDDEDTLEEDDATLIPVTDTEDGPNDPIPPPN